MQYSKIIGGKMYFFLIRCICPFKYQLSIFMKFTPKLWFILLNLQLETQF